MDELIDQAQLEMVNRNVEQVERVQLASVAVAVVPSSVGREEIVVTILADVRPQPTEGDPPSGLSLLGVGT